MSREMVLMIIGAVVLLAPWSGLPLAWLTWILPLLGLAVIGIGFTLRKRTLAPSLPPAPPHQPSQVHEEPQPRSSHIAFS